MKKLILLCTIFCAFLTVLLSQPPGIENAIIRAIDLECPQEGTCYISLAEATNFRWDSVSVYINGGDSAELGIGYIEPFVDGIIFYQNGHVIRDHSSYYHFPQDTYPRLSYSVERGTSKEYFKNYTYDEALLFAEKIKLENGKYRYILVA